MPRKRRVCPPGVAQHLIQRGNNRQICFASGEDCAAYATNSSLEHDHGIRRPAESEGRPRFSRNPGKESLNHRGSGSA